MITIKQLKQLTALQAEDEALWAAATNIETAYAQMCLRILTDAIEDDLPFEQAKAAIKDCLT